MAISNGGQCPQLNSGLGTSHGWLSSMWIERSDTLIHALGYNTTLFAGQSEGWYVLILVPKKLEDLETFNAVLQRGARGGDGPGVLGLGVVGPSPAPASASSVPLTGVSEQRAAPTHHYCH